MQVLRRQGALSRAAIAATVGLSRSTLSEITADLLARGAIVVLDTDAGEREGSGRPAERLALHPASGHHLGVDFGHGRVHVAVADSAHRVIASGVERWDDPATSWGDRIAAAFALVDRLVRDRGIHFGALAAVGIGVPGPWSRALGGHPGDAPVPRAVEGSPGDVERAFAERFGAPVLMDNNTRLAALAEAIVDTPTVRDLLYVRVSDGVGGGLVVGGRLVTGATGLAGEVGHVTVRPEGRVCRCGKTGCLETVAAVPHLLADVRAAGVPVGSLADLRAAVLRSHPAVDRVLREAAAALGRVVGAVAMVVNPAEIVLGGEVVRVAPVLVEQVAATVAYEMFPRASDRPTVRGARLSDDVGALGALAAVFHGSPVLADYPDTAGVRS